MRGKGGERASSQALGRLASNGQRKDGGREERRRE